jgi:hypothetical protein
MTLQIWPGLSWVFFERGDWLNPRMAASEKEPLAMPGALLRQLHCSPYRVAVAFRPGAGEQAPLGWYLSAESWKMHDVCLGHSLERIPRFAPGCQAAYDDKCLKSPFP